MSRSREGSFSTHPDYKLFKPGKFEKLQEVVINEAFPNEKKLRQEKAAAKVAAIKAELSMPRPK